MAFEPDFNQQQSMEVSNDTFHFLQFGEEPIDDYYQQEIEEIVNMFPTGFFISDYFFVDDAGTVIITIMPYAEVDFSPHFMWKMCKGVYLECERRGSNIAFRYAYDNREPGKIKVSKVLYDNSAGEYWLSWDDGYEPKDEFVSGHCSMYFMKSKGRIDLKKAAV